MRTWLVLDVNYLAWRAAHSTGGLSHKGVGTGVVYGVMRDVIALQDLHNTKRIVFCFDHSRKYLKRCKVYPDYKSHRDKKKRKPHEEELYKEVHRQLVLMRKQLLPSLGFRNILCEKGYEADDLVASVIENLPPGDEAVLVARDKDYYQLLGPRCVIWNPSKGKAITAASFTKEYGIEPSQWADVKALAGCTSDHVEGIHGIGEKTAAAFLNGQLKPKSSKHVLIVLHNKIWKRNLPLVRLPYEGTPVFKLKKDKINEREWQRMCRRFGFRSLLGGQHGKGRSRPPQGFGIRA